jgi:hypothetical protein
MLLLWNVHFETPLDFLMKIVLNIFFMIFNKKKEQILEFWIFLKFLARQILYFFIQQLIFRDLNHFLIMFLLILRRQTLFFLFLR